MVNVTPDLKQAVELTQNGPRVVLTKLRGNDAYATRNTASITLHPWVWYNIFSLSCVQINNLLSLLSKEASLASEKRKLLKLDSLTSTANQLFKATWQYVPESSKDELAAQQKLFKAAWDIPSLAEESTTDLPSLADETTDQ